MNDVPEDLPLLATPRTEYILVNTFELLQQAVADLKAGTGYIAVDAERASGFRYHQSAYLIQLHRVGSKIHLVDPVAFKYEELDSLRSFMNGEPWILHAATQDLPCLNELGFEASELFDTEHVSRLLGYPKVGLGAICELALGMRLAKEHSAADWSTRPLPEGWLVYAALDVDVLPEMREFLMLEIARQGKEELVAQDMAHIARFKPKPVKVDKWRSLSNLHTVKDQRGLAVAQALWSAREELAKSKDTSPGRILPDTSIVFAAAAIPRSKSELAGSKQFIGRGSRTFLDTWWKAIEQGLSARELPPIRVPSAGIPNHRSWPEKFPAANARLVAAKELIAAVSEENNIPLENILQPDALRELCWNLELLTSDRIATFLAERQARKWQIELLAEKLSTIFCELEEL